MGKNWEGMILRGSRVNDADTRKLQANKARQSASYVVHNRSIFCILITRQFPVNEKLK